MKRTCPFMVAMLLLTATLGWANDDSTNKEALGIEVERLWSDVRREPDNVDIRLKLALCLSRTDGTLDEAEKQARMVAARAPDYWDAHLLLARIAGRKKHYDEALLHVETILRKDAKHLEARLLKIDLLIWSGDRAGAEKELNALIALHPDIPALYTSYAQIEFEKSKFLSAYRRAKQALSLDPTNTRAKNLIRDVEFFTVYASHEFELYGFSSADSKKDRFGYGLSLSGRVFRSAHVSAALIEVSRYRFQTINNQVGLEVNLRPMRLLELTLRGLFGAPAEVIPKGSLFFSARAELWKRMDMTPAYALDILAWPEEKAALLHRPSLTIGLYIDQHFNFTAGYTMGLLKFCGRTPTIIHSVNTGISVGDENVSVHGFYSFGQEIDPYILGAVSISSCEMIDAAENSIQQGYAGFRLVDLRIHTGGMMFSWMLTPKLSITGGYRFELRMIENSAQIIPAHISNLGLVTSF